jgi:NAD(P)-dependent dehydrogenase (short-subunit alcohol dehydrogenase family)
LKVALVTGAARGIGRAAADALQKAGLRVVRLDLQGELAYDLTDVAGIAKLVESLGDIHVLVNNAGFHRKL